MSVKQYVQTSKGPIRFDALRPGSFFRISSEYSRGIKHSNDSRMYQKAYDGFYSYVAGDKATGVVLMPGDTVIAFKQVHVGGKR